MADTTEAALLAPNQTGKGYGHIVPVATLRQFVVLNKRHIPATKMAIELRVAKSTVDRWRSFIKKGKFEDFLKRTKRLAKNQNQERSIVHRPTITERALPRTRGTFPAFATKIVQLRAQGMPGREIANRLHKTTGQIYYWLAKMNGSQKSKPKKGETHGVTNPFNKDILLGIAYAETERFIANLEARIKTPPRLLRRRLPELLGHSPLWG